MIAVVRYNAGNVFSVECALNRLGVEFVLTADEKTLRSADKVIFPGVGEAAAAMHHLRSTGLDRVLCNLTNPVLGICIGQQLMCRHSEEGDVDCLGIFDADVRRLVSTEHNFKIPHTGWDTVTVTAPDGPVPEMLDGQYFYYVHSYVVPVNSYTAAITDYCGPWSAAMHRDNFYAVQFHPEKSGAAGTCLLSHFLNL